MAFPGRHRLGDGLGSPSSLSAEPSFLSKPVTGSFMSYVNLSGTRICDDDLTCLEGLSDVDALDLSGTLVTDAGMAHLQRLTGLQMLILDGTRVTAGGVAALRRALPDLSIVISRPFPPSVPLPQPSQLGKSLDSFCDLRS
jgi:hypothetical protein